MKLICVFVFAYANCWFSHEAARICLSVKYTIFDSQDKNKKKINTCKTEQMRIFILRQSHGNFWLISFKVQK